MKNIVLSFAALTALFCTAIQPAFAQKNRARTVSYQTNVAPQAPQVQVVQVPEVETVMLYAGTPVDLETVLPTDAKDMRVGQTIDFRVQYDVVVNRRIVIMAGSPARGIVTRLDKPKMMGKGGFMEIQPQYITTVDNQMLPIRANPIRLEGKKNGWAWAGVAVGLATGGIGAAATGFIKGKSARLESGMTISASIAATREIYLD